MMTDKVFFHTPKRVHKKITDQNVPYCDINIECSMVESRSQYPQETIYLLFYCHEIRTIYNELFTNIYNIYNMYKNVFRFLKLVFEQINK